MREPGLGSSCRSSNPISSAGEIPLQRKCIFSAFRIGTRAIKFGRVSVSGKPWQLTHSSRPHQSRPLLLRWLLELDVSPPRGTSRTTLTGFFPHLIKQKLPVASLFLLKLIKAFLIHKLRNLRTQLLFSSISDSDISLGPHIIRVSSGTILTSNEKDIVKGIRSKFHHDRYFD